MVERATGIEHACLAWGRFAAWPVPRRQRAGCGATATAAVRAGLEVSGHRKALQRLTGHARDQLEVLVDVQGGKPSPDRTYSG